MFKQYVLASNFKRIATRLSKPQLKSSIDFIPSFNILPGDETYVIANIQNNRVQQAEFGLRGLEGKIYQKIPFVRSEGDRNANDDPNYTGAKAIFLKPEFKRLIRSQRCLVLADAFIVESMEEKPYLVYLRNKNRPFAFAGIWNNYKNEKTCEDINTFAIITTTANPLLSLLGLKRMPVILTHELTNRWLRSSTPLTDILAMLNPYPHDLMNAYPIARIEGELNVVSLIQPIGKPIMPEIKNDWSRKKKKVARDQFDKPNLGERAGLKK